MVKEYYIMNGKQIKAETVLKSIKKYMSGKGKITRQNYLKKHSTTLRKYNINYQNELRQKRRENNLCLICGKKRDDEKLSCIECRQKTKFKKKMMKK